jgi:hypothetical protein
MMCEKSRGCKAKSSAMSIEELAISNQQSAISNQHPATNMNGGWTIPAAAHIWAPNGFSEEIDTVRAMKASGTAKRG